jgi:predicted transcriptional regulator
MNLRRVLWHLVGATRGGPMRLRLIALLRERPYNTNQVSELLHIDYKTAQHHLRVLVENRVAEAQGDRYGAQYFLTKEMLENLPEFDMILQRLARHTEATHG